MNLRDRIATMTGISMLRTLVASATPPDAVSSASEPDSVFPPQETTAPVNRTEGFDSEHYLRFYPDVRAAGVDPLAHYLEYGWKEGRNPSAEFDTVFYRIAVSGATHPDLCPLVHYNTLGQMLGAPRNCAESLAVGFNGPEPAELINALPALGEHFDADFYVERYPDVLLGTVAPLEHYLTYGWREGRNPSAYFDTVFYRETFQKNDASDICPFVHWLRYGVKAGLPTSGDAARIRTVSILETGQPDSSEAFLDELDNETTIALLSPHFDVEHYLRAYPDVCATGVDPLAHYLHFGWKEGRNPNQLFDAPWYVGKYMSGRTQARNPLLHFATIGRMARLPSSMAMTHMHLERTADSAFADWMRRLMHQLRFDTGPLDLDGVRRFVLPLFSAASYRRDRSLPNHVSDADAFLRYLILDFPSGHPPGPMFQADHYLGELSHRRMAPPPPGEPPLHHWLAHGASAGISPSPGFNAEDYLALNRDLARYPGSLFEHFIRHGQYEGRRFSRLTTIAGSRLATVVGDTFTKARRFCEAAAPAGGADGELTRMRAFMRSGALDGLVREATTIEPDVGCAEPDILSIIPPWFDESWMDYTQFLRVLPEGSFDAIVLMPFCKLGGADFVAGVLTTVLSETSQVLVIRTDADDWARPDWFPEDVATVDLSALFRPLAPEMRSRILYEILQRYRPGTVYNVNSRLAFETFVRYGERLALRMRLCAYYFCADRTPKGVETGYPVWYFSNILPWLAAAMIDNQALADRLVNRYSLTGAYRDRVRLIYTPAMTEIPHTTMAEAQLANSGSRDRKRVLWGGRLDAQKRFDLVRQIAQLLPEVHFDCWGKAVLDAPPDLSSLPPNLSVHPPFVTYDDLPLAEADGWLYTSAWDGMPTILIELAALGVPIVASAVGGVPELIDETTGWPVGENATAEDYAAAIEAMIASPEERVARSRALQERARRQHGRQAYADAIAAIASAGGRDA